MSSISWLDKPLRISTSESFHNKQHSDVSAFSDGWVNQELSIAELADWVQHGLAYCSELKGSRNSKNFTASGILSVDIDDGMTWDEAKEHPLVKSSASMMYTSANHTEENHKFRIIFALENPIEDAGAMQNALRSLALRLGGDPAATDPARLFFGSEDCKLETFKQGLSDDKVNELIEQSKNARTGDFVSRSQHDGTPRSTLNIPHESLITTATGDQFPIENLEPRTSVHCLFHADRNASAFMVESKNGDKGIHCSKCGTTFWTNTSDPSADFFAFDRVAKAIKENAEPEAADFMFDYDSIHKENIYFLSKKYLPNYPVANGATFIKSPKGSGKTEFLANLIAQQKGNILLIGHRRSLIKQMCDRLGLNCYLDDGKPDEDDAAKSIQIRNDNLKRQRRYGICLDSVNKIKKEITYDFVLIDESEQVLSHFLSETLDDKRNHVFQRFKHILSKSRNLYALDADLDFISLHFLSKWYRASAENKNKKSRLIINQHVEDRGTLHIIEKRDQLIGDFHRAIGGGLKCYITSSSKNFISQQLKTLQERFPKKKFIAITSATVGKEGSGTTEFLDNPAAESKKYDAVLASPSVSTGVDISFPDNEQFFDVVYADFDNVILSHFECDQQIARVRHPKATKIYLTKRRYFYETNFDVMMFDALSMTMMDHLLEGYDQDDKPQYRTDDELLQLACALFSYKRKSINNLRDNFCEYKQANGWTIEFDGFDPKLESDGHTHDARGKYLTNQERITGLLSAPKLDDETFKQLREKYDGEVRLSDTEYAAFSRAVMERFYNQEISETLIRRDSKGKYRAAVRRYDRLSNPEFLKLYLQFNEIKQEQDENLSFLFANEYHEVTFILRALTAAKLFANQKLQTEKDFTKDDLGDFIKFIRKNRLEYERLLNMNIRKDLRAKPTNTVNHILKLIGLKLGNPKKTTKDKKTIYKYKIDQKSLDEVHQIINQRSQKG